MAINSKDKNLNKNNLKNTKSIIQKSETKKPQKTMQITPLEDASIKKLFKTIENKKTTPIILEYYDLPYRYNKTTVKFLAQNPHTLFVYWEISDEDKNNLIKKYGNDFFKTTIPLLVLTDLKNNKTYEIQIDDFTNNWYIHVNESHLQYQITLARKFKEIKPQLPLPLPIQNYISIVKSNVLETPNDHILFFKPNEKLEFKNILTNRITSKRITNNDNKQIKAIYKNYNELLNNKTAEFDFNNPSSAY